MPTPEQIVTRNLLKLKYPFARSDFIDHLISLETAKKGIHGRFIARSRKYTNSVRMTLQGELFKVQTFSPERKGKEQWYRRGLVNGLSAKSRKRLLEKGAIIDWKNHKAIFVTLTYAKNFPHPRKAKAHFRALVKRMFRRFRKWDGAVLWRMEAQERGAPHFHAIFFDLPFIPYAELRFMWREITGDEEIKMVRIEMLDSPSKGRRYIAKYISKEKKEYEFDLGELTGAESRLFNSMPYSSGRVWGVENRKALPVCPVNEWVAYCPDTDSLKAMIFSLKQRAMIEWAYIRECPYRGFTLFTSNSAAWQDNVYFTLIDST